MSDSSARKQLPGCRDRPILSPAPSHLSRPAFHPAAAHRPALALEVPGGRGGPGRGLGTRPRILVWVCWVGRCFGILHPCFGALVTVSVWTMKYAKGRFCVVSGL